MAMRLQRLDPERRRRRLRLLAELADAKALRERVAPNRLHADRLRADRLRADRLRELIVTRRRRVG
jgi:hypothetical protein